MKWAERLPVIDPATVWLDKYWEKGFRGRFVESLTDIQGREGRGRIDTQLEQLGGVLEQARPRMTRGQTGAFTAALEAQKSALERELGTIGAFDQDAVSQDRVRISSEIEKYEGMTDEYVPYRSSLLGDQGELGSWILGSAYVQSGSTMKRSKAIENLRDQLSQLPDTRTERVREQLQGVREQLGLAPALPYIGAVTPLTEPLYGERLKEERARRMREPVVPAQLQVLPRIGAVTPLTEALTGAEREAEIARRMGVVPEPVVAPIFPTLPDQIIAPGKAIAETEDTDTAPARRVFGETDQGQWRYRMPEIRKPRLVSLHIYVVKVSLHIVIRLSV